jgi:hypothetical protein
MSELRIDWFRVLADLQRSGRTNADVAHALKVAPTTLAGWKMGSQPKYEEGSRLLDMWREIIGLNATPPRL